QKLFTQMELATIFLVHTITTFGGNRARIGFVLPRSVMSADQNVNLRVRTYKAPMESYQLWDLVGVQPVFNVPTCVVFGKKTEIITSRKTEMFPVGNTSYSLPAVEWNGNLPSRDVSWREAEKYLRSEQATARIIYLGERTALSTRPGRTKSNYPSLYAKEFRQGATIVPRSFYFVNVAGLDGELDPDRLYWAETDPEQEAKEPYKNIRLKGHVEGR